MKKFTHLIVSRVNVRWLPQSKDETWLKNRIKLFDGILRPSIAAQTNKNFKFVTLWGYPPERKIENEYQLFIDVEYMDRIHAQMIPRLLELVDTDYVITTRVDTDNALRYDFVENLHRHIAETEALAETEVPFYYDITKMGVYSFKTKNKKVWTSEYTSAFISIIEDCKNYKCIPFGYSHPDIGKHFKGLNFDDLGVMCTLHEENVAMKSEFGDVIDFNINEYGLKIC